MFCYGKSPKPVAYGSKCRIKEMSDCFYYIPILETLTALLNNKQIMEEILKEPHYRSDGAVFSNHELFPSDAQALL